MRHLTFKGQKLDISNAASTPQWPNIRYSIQRRACANSSVLTMFVLAGSPDRPVEGPTRRPGIRLKQRRNLWQSGRQTIYVQTRPFGIR